MYVTDQGKGGELLPIQASGKHTFRKLKPKKKSLEGVIALGQNEYCQSGTVLKIIILQNLAQCHLYT